MCALQKCKIRDRRACTGHLTCFLILGSLNISGLVKATKFQKLSTGMTGISGQRLHCGPGAEPIVGGAEEGGFIKTKHTKHLHICLSMLLAILFKYLPKMPKKSVSLLHFHTPVGIISLILPSTSLRPVAEIWYRVSCNCFTCFNDDCENWWNSAH